MKKILSVLMLLAMCSMAWADITYVDSSTLGLGRYDYNSTYKVVTGDQAMLAMSVHDRYWMDGVADVWDISDGVYGANAGYFTNTFSSGATLDMAKWSFEVLVSPEVPGVVAAPFITGTVDFQSFDESQFASYTGDDITYLFDITLPNANFDSRNFAFADLGLDSFDANAEGIYTIEMTYGNLVNSIQVQIGETPAVPAPAALLLGAFGTALVGGIRRRIK